MSIDPELVKQVHAQHVMRIYEQSREGGGNVALTPAGIARILEDYEAASHPERRVSGFIDHAPGETEDDPKRAAERWSLAGDDNMTHLLVWQRVKKRAEAGGFNGVLASDYAHADEALAVLVQKLGGNADRSLDAPGEHPQQEG